MKIFPVADVNCDNRRDLTAFRPPSDFPKVAEAKLITVKHDGVRLGNHSHPHVEGFFLVAGSCVIRTWTADQGLKDKNLSSPAMFMFEPGEEHLLVCSAGMQLVGYMPITFAEENNTAAAHL